MSNKTGTKSVTQKKVAAIKRLMADKKAIHQEIKKGGNLSGVNAKGIRFVKPL